jgi:hypothetical protein
MVKLSIIPVMAILAALQDGAATRPTLASIDYAKIERKITKEPAYVGSPRYALFLLDEAGEFRVWAVMDKSAADVPAANVLYLDMNGNGDLTEEGERFVSSRDAVGIEERGAVITVAAVPVPGKKLRHEEFRFSVFAKGPRTGICFNLKWAGREPMYGGFGLSCMNWTPWGATIAEAPVFHPNPYGPLSFALWGEPVLKLEDDNNVNLFAGNRGSGSAAYSVVTDKFLAPGKDRVFVTVVAKDGEGREVRLRTEITGHC